MNYKYEFDKEECWYKSACKYYNSEECKDTCLSFLKMHYLVNHSLLGKRYQHPIILFPDKCDIESFEYLVSIRKDIVNYVKCGRSLLLLSKDTGVGKTTWSSKLMLQYLSKIKDTSDFKPRALFINVPDLCNRLKLSISRPDETLDYILKYIKDVDLVVWDDIGSDSISSYEHGNIYSIINYRVDNNKSNIYTTNATEEKLKELFGVRLWSRIYNMSDIVEFYGTDKRGL